MSEIHLYSNVICPFAQRARIMLRFKGIEHRTTEIDLSKPRPTWFKELNAAGAVPVIQHGDRVLVESSIICEYLDEAFPTPPAFPREPYGKAIARLLIGYGNESFIPAMYALLTNQERSRHEELTEKALATWRWIDGFLRKHNPQGVFLDDRLGFGMAEINFAGFLLRYCLNGWYRDFRLPEELSRVRRWRDAILSHPLVLETGLPEEDLIKVYFDYSRGYRSGKIPPGAACSSLDLSVPVDERPMPPRGYASSESRPQ